MVPTFCCWVEIAFESEVLVCSIVPLSVSVVEAKFVVREAMLVDKASIFEDKEFMRTYPYMPPAMKITATTPKAITRRFCSGLRFFITLLYTIYRHGFAILRAWLIKL